MVISLYDVIQGVVVTSMVTGSLVYLFAAVSPGAFRKHRSLVRSCLGLHEKKDNTQPEHKKSVCTHCSLCSGCPISGKERP